MSDYLIFNFKDATYKRPKQPLEFNFIGNIFYILGGNSNNFTAIWADEKASRSSFKFYSASTGHGASLSVVDLSTKQLVDFYTTSHTGAANEKLTSEDVVDINIGSRG